MLTFTLCWILPVVCQLAVNSTVPAAADDSAATKVAIQVPDILNRTQVINGRLAEIEEDFAEIALSMDRSCSNALTAVNWVSYRNFRLLELLTASSDDGVANVGLDVIEQMTLHFNHIRFYRLTFESRLEEINAITNASVLLYNNIIQEQISLHSKQRSANLWLWFIFGGDKQANIALDEESKVLTFALAWLDNTFFALENFVFHLHALREHATSVERRYQEVERTGYIFHISRLVNIDIDLAMLEGSLKSLAIVTKSFQE